MQLAGIQNETVDLEVLKSPQVVPSYVKFTDINIQTSVTNPLASIKCSESSSGLKQENIEQSKDDSNVKRGFKHIAGEDMEKFLAQKKPKKDTRERQRK